jgi:hypothetical protein
MISALSAPHHLRGPGRLWHSVNPPAFQCIELLLGVFGDASDHTRIAVGIVAA